MGNICFTAFLQGYGFLLRHRWDRVHVIFCRNVIDTFTGMVDEIRASRCGMALLKITVSEFWAITCYITKGPQCLFTHSDMGERQESNQGLGGPPSLIAQVSFEGPEVMLVRAQAASNCKQA